MENTNQMKQPQTDTKQNLGKPLVAQIAAVMVDAMRRRNQGLTYCRPSRVGKGRVARTSTKWCNCGHKRHSPNHEQGEHHKNGIRQSSNNQSSEHKIYDDKN